MERRTVVLGGLAAVAGIVLWQADIPPHPVPDERDTALLADVVAAQTDLLGLLKASGANAAVLAAVTAQLVALGVDPDEANRVAETSVTTDPVATVLDTAAAERAEQAMQARARDLIVTLASISGGLRQLAEHLRLT